MLKGMEISEVVSKVQENARLKRDFVADSKALVFLDDTTLRVGNETLQYSDHFMSQFCQRVGVPANYVRKLYQRNPKFLASVANEALEASPNEKRMVRVLGNTARAYLSNSYKRIDNDVILPSFLKTLEARGGKIIGANVEHYGDLKLKVIFPDTLEVRPNDKMQFGFIFKNSEIGNGAYDLLALLFRLVCTNGMIVAGAEIERFRRYHRGARINFEGIQELPDGRLIINEAQTLAEMSEGLENALNSKGFQNIVEALQLTAGTQIVGDIEKIAQGIAETYGVSEKLTDVIVRKYQSEGDLTHYGLINAVTYAAHQGTNNFEQSTQLETLGGELLYLPSAKIEAFAVAA